ncbi:MAG: KH domain-containing protein [Dehalococcoidia bacterium]
MKDLIEYMARAIVEYPDEVAVTEEQGPGGIVYRLRVAESDMGRVIGKEGRIANAMRTLLKVAAIRKGTRAVLEIGEGTTRPALGAEPELWSEPEPSDEPELESEDEA